MTWRAIASLVCAALLVTGGSAGARSQIVYPPVTEAAVAALERWLGAVDGHAPGRMDEAVRVVWAMSPRARLEVSPAIELFLALLTGAPFHAKVEPALKAKIALLVRVRAPLGANRFLERAAVLHGDAAMSAGQAPAPAVEDVIAFPAPRPGDLPSPFFPQGQMLVDADGESIGETPRNWNWTFARDLVSRVRPRPADDPLVAAWYHATTAHMFWNGLYGEASWHLQAGLALLPDDARLRFDRGCLAEINGLPVSQQLLTDADLAALRILMDKEGRLPRRAAAWPLLSAAARRAGIPPVEIANDIAERWFRSALAVDPAFVEVRVRLARLLDVRGRHEEAATELAAAIPAIDDPVLMFYAHLFAGRANRALGLAAAAAGHYRDALALFPEAQSALLGASQIALLSGDVSRALSPVRRLDGTSGDDRKKDPWWDYRLSAGRHADALLTEMWSKVP